MRERDDRATHVEVCGSGLLLLPIPVCAYESIESQMGVALSPDRILFTLYFAMADSSKGERDWFQLEVWRHTIT